MRVCLHECMCATRAMHAWHHRGRAVPALLAPQFLMFMSHYVGAVN